MLDKLHAVRGGTLEGERERIGGLVRGLVGRFPLPY